jgi:hypothetical protein
MEITNIATYRIPIRKILDNALNLISLGKWNKEKDNLGFDVFFHLALVATVGNKNIFIDKVEVIKYIN